jgi:hypothetical protein
MKLKYEVAIKYYTETKNNEQLRYAYNEIEGFTESYNNFKFYYKFDLEYIKNKFGCLFIEELDLDPKIQRSEFLQFLDKYKLKVADNYFQQGNFNLDLIKYAVNKVISQENKLKEEIDINNLWRTNKVNNLISNHYRTYSILASFTLILISFALIVIHFYLYMRNPLNFFNRINE